MILKKTEKNSEFDLYKDTYQESVNDTLGRFGKHAGNHNLYLEIKANHIKSFISNSFKGKKIKLLDYGCGHGLLHAYFDPNYFDIYGCDPASEVINLAKESNPVYNYASFDGVTLPYENQTFDLSIAVCVMHHIKPIHWERSLNEMKRVTKEDGFIAVYEHNPKNPLAVHIVNNCPLDKDANLLNMTTLLNLFHKIGLKNLSKEFIIFFPFKSRFFRKVEKFLTILPLGAQYFLAGKVQHKEG